MSSINDQQISRNICKKCNAVYTDRRQHLKRCAKNPKQVISTLRDDVTLFNPNVDKEMVEYVGGGIVKDEDGKTMTVMGMGRGKFLKKMMNVRDNNLNTKMEQFERILQGEVRYEVSLLKSEFRRPPSNKESRRWVTPNSVDQFID